MKFDFIATNDHLTINAEGVEETSTSFEVAMGTVFKGDTGNGIDSITQTSISEDELEKTYTITYTDGNEFEYIVKDGNSILSIEYIGISADGLQKTYQVNYQDGTTFQYVVNQGVGIKTITKTSTTLLTDTYTITFANNSTTTFNVKNGNGIESIIKTNTNVLVDTYTITFTDTTTTTFDVTNAKSITNIEFVSTNLLTDIYKINFNDNTNILFNVANGRGITNISYISTNGLVDTYRITYNDNTTSDFIVTNGQGYSNKGDWEAGTTYKPFDVVKYLNSVYVCLVENTNSTPSLINPNWVVWIDSSIMVNKTSIKQVLGTSTTDVMSQKAVTDNLELKIDKTSITGVFGQDATKVISQKGFTDNISEILQLEGEELYAYGVKWTEVQTSPSLERIGNINMHKTLPCHKTRGCLVKNDGSINYYLHPSSDLLKADGVTPSVLDGTDGDVMNYRKFYYRTAIKDGVHVNWMSPYPLQGYTLYEGFTGRYKASINRTTGKIHSVINTTPAFRGGINNAAWDSDGRSLLGCAVSGINRATFRSGARINRSTDWNGARGHDDNFALLIYFRVKWATHNTQLAYNAALDASGYYQGGMGSGTTNLSGAKWGGYNGYNPFIPCGYTKEFGDGSGVKDFVMPFEYDAYNTVAAAQKYTGVYSDARGYATGEYCSDGVDSYKGSGTATLYRCKADAAAGVALSNTTHFETVTRTITQAIRMDGEEQWFGEIWEFYSDVLIEMDATAQTSKCYIFRNQSQIAETRTGNEEFLCNLPITDGYVKLFNENSIFPKSTGGGSTTFGCDYTYIGFPASGVSLRGCLGGGAANDAADAGASSLAFE